MSALSELVAARCITRKSLPPCKVAFQHKASEDIPDYPLRRRNDGLDHRFCKLASKSDIIEPLPGNLLCHRTYPKYNVAHSMSLDDSLETMNMQPILSYWRAHRISVNIFMMKSACGDL